MNPFASLLHSVRTERGVRQAELAELIGYEQTYISALEVGKKGPPTREFVRRVSDALDLPEDERNRLSDAADASQRKLVVDGDLPQEAFWMLRELRVRISSLAPSQIQLIRQVLALPESLERERTELPRRIRRRDAAEAKM